MTETLQHANDAPNFSKIVEARFRIDHAGGALKGQPEYFEGVPMLAALQLIEFGALFDEFQDEKLDMVRTPQVIRDMMNLVLTDESYERFITRLSDKIDPIGLEQLMNSVTYLMECYGMRPTQPSEHSSSSGGNPDAGTSSTSSSSELVPTSSPSPQTDF